MPRVVVIGAGIGGLAVSARLASVGHHVVVCEQGHDIGGKLMGHSSDGFTFDTGPSLLTLPAVYRDLFHKTGRPLEDCVDLLPVDPAFRYYFAPTSESDAVWLDVPNASRPQMRDALDLSLGGGAGADWDAFLDDAHRVWQLTRGPFLESPLSGRRDLLRLLRRTRDIRTVAPWRTLRSAGRRQLRDPRLRMMLDRYATYTGSDPRRAPAALSVVPYVEQTFGAWHVRGGVHRLADAVLDRALSRGVEVRTQADVVRVLVEGGRVSGVVLASGERLPADVVVSDADASTLYGELLPHSVGARVRRRIARTKPSLSGFVLLLALRGRTPDLAHHTVLFPADYDAELDAVFGPEVHPVDDPTVYVCSPADHTMHPPGCEALFVLVNAPRHGRARGLVDWEEPGLADSYADRVLAVMAARGVDVRDRVLWRKVRTPADLERDTRSPGGAIYGTASTRSGVLRPANRSPVPGLFLVGGSAHPGGGLPLVGLSAAIVADLIGPA